MTATTSKTYWIERDGGRVAIGHASLLLGRGADCDIVLSDERVSRHHALFRLVDEGVEVIPFGRQPLTLNGAVMSAPATLRGGDRVACFDQVFEVVEAPSLSAEADVLWGIERSPGSLFRVSQSPFRVGGSTDDHLHIVGWPATVLALHRVGASLSLEARREGVFCGAELAPGECVRIKSGARVSHAGQLIRVLALPVDPSRVTAATVSDDLPTAAELRFLPRGGRLTLRLGGRERSVYLPDRRCDLIACLLQPPAPLAPGDLVPDDVVIGRVWAARTQTKVELNTVLFRARQDLIKADIDGTALIARQGGSVRFNLAPGATVKVVVT
ncbi:MAG: FHA domain-containing protein [Polyangiales bacterium]